MTWDGIPLFLLYVISTCGVHVMVLANRNETFEMCLKAHNISLTDEQRLLSKLMTSYSSETRPVYNASSPVQVLVGLSITQIFDVDEKNQVLTTNVWLDQEWYDEKLLWDPDDYNGLSTLRIPCLKIWLPDIVLYNSATDYNEKYMEALAMVDHNGHVFWPPIVKFRSSCEMDITFFPFDDQICKLKLGSWAYDGFQVNVSGRTPPIDFSNFVVNGEWELVKAEAVNNVVYYPCCDTPFPDVTFYIHIRRRTTYYIYNVIIPSVMLSSLALLGFWLHPDGGEKTTLGLTVLLALSVFMLLIADNTPATSFYVPLLGVYLIATMSFTSLSVIVAVLISNVHAKGRREKPLPRWLRKLVIILSKLLCYKTKYILRNTYYATCGETIITTSTSSSNGECHGSFKRVQNNETKTIHMVLPNYEEQHGNPIHVTSSQNTSDVYSSTILQALQCLLDQHSSREKEDEIRREWEEAAVVLDRFLFWTFLVGSIFSSVYLLVICPMIMKDKDIGKHIGNI